MSVLLPEAVQILVKNNKFEITDEEASLLQLSCMLNVYFHPSDTAWYLVQVRCALFQVKLRKRLSGL